MAEEKQGRKRVHWGIGLLGCLVLSVVVMLLGRTGLLYELELKSYDARFLLRGPVPVDHSDVVIVEIDDETFLTMPTRWEFPRRYYAHLMENLFGAGARMVVFDIQFTEPSDDATQDSILARATAQYPDSVIHAGKIVYYQDARLDTVITEVLVPVDVIMETDPAVGIVNELKDRDGFTRQYPLYAEHGGTNWLPLSVKAAQLAAGLGDSVKFLRKPDEVEYGPYHMKRMAEGTQTMLINYYGPTGTFPSFSMSDVMDDESFDLRRDDTDFMRWFLMSDQQFAMLEMVLPEEAVEPMRELRESNPFKDKIVFVGASAAELQDLKRTPFYAWDPPGQEMAEREMPGVEAHAHAFQTIMDGRYITNVSPWLDFLLVLVLVLIVFAVVNTTRILVGSITTLLLAGLLTVGVFYAFIEHRLWVALIAPLAGVLLAYLGTTIYQYILEQKEKAMIRGMFSQYVPRKVVNELINNPDMMALGGERRRMTVLFTDVAGFTTLSEGMEPEDLVGLLNEYLSEMSRIILENEGIIDKYEGDLIMAEWGAPVYFQEHAFYACRAALRMQERLAQMRTDWKTRGMPELVSRVGINTGPMIVGNMGCLEVFDYTVMGDAVNLASRLEGANKAYGSTIMIGPDTYEDIEGRFVTRELDDIRVKGKEKPVRVYELLALNLEELEDFWPQLLEHYTEGRRHYSEGRFAEGAEAFRRALELNPDDGPSKTYLQRCTIYREAPPPEAWDGVFEMQSK